MQNGSAAAAYHEEALDWEASRVEQLERSERRAWTVAVAACVMALLAWLGIAFMLPLKEAVPYVIRVDNATGVPDIVTSLQDKRVGYDEVMDKYWVASYVRARETYDWYTLQHEYTTVNLLSSPNVAGGYNRLFEGPDALDKKFGNSVRVTTTVASIVLNGHGIATVRFARYTKPVADGSPDDATKWVATLGYEYRNPSKLRESLRLTNPLGFQVTSYRIDPEVGAP